MKLLHKFYIIPFIISTFLCIQTVQTQITFSNFLSSVSLLKYFVHYIHKAPVAPISQPVKIALFHDKDFDFIPYALKHLIYCIENSEIKGIIIYINQATGISPNLISDLKRLKISKPIIAFVEDSCIYESYWTLCIADSIIASPFANIGVIGVYRKIAQYSDQTFDDEHLSGNITHTYITGGKFKAAGNPDVPLTDAHKQYLQEQVNQIYKEFYTFVAQERNLSLDNLEDWAEGKIFIAYEALELGLIDAIGCYTDAKYVMEELLQQKDIDVSAGLNIIDINTLNPLPQEKT
ncbi:MAG: S49 family peptidase [Candidatus Babeliaceae bacterium]